MKTFFVAALALFTVGLSTARQDAPPPAKAVLSKALAEAASSGRTVFVGFHASWCGWCKRMEKVLAEPAVKAIWDKHVVTVWLVVLESPEKKRLENAGADALMKENGGENAGIPYFYFMDANGKSLMNSTRLDASGKKVGNVGCPYEPEEVAWFMAMLEKATPKMSADERAKIRSAFEALKKADKKDG